MVISGAVVEVVTAGSVAEGVIPVVRGGAAVSKVVGAARDNAHWLQRYSVLHVMCINEFLQLPWQTRPGLSGSLSVNPNRQTHV